MLISSILLVALTQTTAVEVDDNCAPGAGECQASALRDEIDVNELLQHSVLSRSGVEILDEQFGFQVPSAADTVNTPASESMRAQVRALGGVCGAAALNGVGSECPIECPLVARDLSTQNTGGGAFCTFACVPATEAACVAYSPGEPIPDEDMGICRACAIRGCHTCVTPSATMSFSDMNQCSGCSAGYTLLPDGTCLSMYRSLWYIIFAFIGIFLFASTAWFVDLLTRPIINDEGLERGLSTRSRAKPHTPKVLRAPSNSLTPRGSILALATLSGRKLWSLTTNLCTTMVAGPGLTLHFNFMAMVILWALGILIGWVAFAYMVDVSLFDLGVLSAKTPAETCTVIGAGYAAQQRLMWTKIVFVAGCYVWSFLLFIAFGIRQLRLFQTLCQRETTHMDFCCILEGLPSIAGNELVEDILSEEIERATGHKPVGVSVAWEISGVHEDLMKKIDECLDELHEEQIENGADHEAMQGSLTHKKDKADKKERKEKAKADGESPKPQSNFKKVKKSLAGPLRSLRNVLPSTKRDAEPGVIRRLLLFVERGFLSQTVQAMLTRGRRNRMLNIVDEGNDKLDFEVEDELRALHTSSTAFVVFHSAEERDAVIEQAKKTCGITFRDSVLTITEAKNEPDSVNWMNFQDEHVGWMVARVLRGLVLITVSLCIWTFCIYLPYAFYFMSFNYAQGQSPGALERSTFTATVVCGNAAMYLMCSEVANRCKFKYADSRELCYLLLYYFAIMLNVFFDLICAYKVAFMALDGVESRTQDGVLLSDLEFSTTRFESYPMQRDLGWTVFAYAFPCTFLVPFIAQPIFTIFMPYKIMTAIVGYRPDITGSRADVFLAGTPYDLSRYADIALNVVLATLVFWFPSGFTLKMMGAFVFSHVYIFCADQYRVLRAVPAFQISQMNTDWWAQVMLALPCGLLLSCTLFKANCVEDFKQYHLDSDEGLFGYCKHDSALVAKCVVACALHVAAHVFILWVVVPMFGKSETTLRKAGYQECARRLAHSWFSVNPVHVLRSEYVYEHDPPWVFSRQGKEHLMPQNPEIGAFFYDVNAQVEDYSASVKAVSALRNPRRVPLAEEAPMLNFDPDKVMVHARKAPRSPSYGESSSPTSPKSPREKLNAGKYDTA